MDIINKKKCNAAITHTGRLSITIFSSSAAWLGWVFSPKDTEKIRVALNEEYERRNSMRSISKSVLDHQSRILQFFQEEHKIRCNPYDDAIPGFIITDPEHRFNFRDNEYSPLPLCDLLRGEKKCQ